MKKLTSITVIAFVLFMFSACKKSHPVQKDDSRAQIAVKMQLYSVGPKGRIVGKPSKAIIIGQKDRLQKWLLRNNGFKLERTSNVYPTYMISDGGVFESTNPFQPCMDSDGNPCPTPPPVPPCIDQRNEWVQDNYAQWQEEANNTCKARWYHFGCTPGPNSNPIGDPEVYSILVTPSFGSGCWTMPAPKRYDEAFNKMFSPVPVPSTPFDTATLIKKVYMSR